MQIMTKFKVSENGINRAWFWIGAFFLLVFYEFRITEVQVPTIIHDEIGYWANAAYFAGYDWSGAISQMSYFGYGVGLALSLFMRIFKDPIITYQAVMQFFVFLLLCSYFMAYRLAGDLFPKVSKQLITLSCIISVCYPSYIMNARIAWSEHVLFFLTWFAVWLLHSYVKKQHIIKALSFALVLGYLYMCHQRTIGTVFLAIVFVFFMTIKGKVKKRDFIFISLFLVMMLVVHKFIKEDIQNNLWNKTSDRGISVNANDYTGRFESLVWVLSNYGIGSLLVSVVGKFFYIIAASFGILTESVIFMFINIKRCWKRKIVDDCDCTILFSYALVIGAVGLNIIVTMGLGGRIDGLIYGRYMEHVFSPAIMLGICSLVERKLDFRHIWSVNIFILVLSCFVFVFYNRYEYNGYLGVCAVSTCWAYENVGEGLFVFFCCLMTVLVYTLFAMIWKAGKEKIALVIVLTCFLINGVYARDLMYGIESNNKNMIQVADMITQFDTKMNIYVIRGDAPYTYLGMEVLQYILPDYKMDFVKEEDIESLTGEYILFTEEVNSIFLQQNEYMGGVYNGWKMYVPSNSKLYNEMIQNEFERIY